jgi:hypothetical protein
VLDSISRHAIACGFLVLLVAETAGYRQAADRSMADHPDRYFKDRGEYWVRRGNPVKLDTTD